MPRKSLVPRGQGRDELIAATVRLIGSVGVHGVTMRVVADGAGLSLGSASYHFTNRDGLIKTALERHVSSTEALVDTALDTDQPTDTEDVGGVWAALSTLFTDRGHVLVRHELHLDAARATTHRHLHRRSERAIIRLVAAVLAERGADMTDQAVQSMMVSLEATALDAAVRHGLDRTYLRAMTDHLNRILHPNP